MGLNHKDIQKTISQLKGLSSSIELIDTDIEEILDQAVDYLKTITPLSTKNHPHLRHNSYWRRRPGGGYEIVQQGDHVIFLEFGTGVKGANSDYPIDKTNVPYLTYDINFGSGQTANRQMYRTAEYLETMLGEMMEIKFKEGKNSWLQS